MFDLFYSIQVQNWTSDSCVRVCVTLYNNVLKRTKACNVSKGIGFTLLYGFTMVIFVTSLSV